MSVDRAAPRRNRVGSLRSSRAELPIEIRSEALILPNLFLRQNNNSGGFRFFFRFGSGMNAELAMSWGCRRTQRGYNLASPRAPCAVTGFGRESRGLGTEALMGFEKVDPKVDF